MIDHRFRVFIFGGLTPTSLTPPQLNTLLSLLHLLTALFAMTTALEVTLRTDLDKRKKTTMPIPDLLRPAPTTAPDFFSSDYLSVTTSQVVRDAFVRNLSSTPRILGSGGSRLGTGNTDAYTRIEERLSRFFGSAPSVRASAALLFNSGYDANRVFWSTVPQKGDAIVFDDLVHISMKDGMSQSRASALYPFEHNSVVAFRKRVEEALVAHPNITEGKGTLFVAVETLYSMDGDFAALRDIFDAADALIPAGCAHLMVDEAHTTGLFGPDGRGLLFELGLEGRVNTVLHTFSKAWGMSGGMSSLCCDMMEIDTSWTNQV